MPHSALERRIIQTLASDTFTRDLETADGLRSFGLDAQFLGNPMFDDLFVEEEPTPTFPQDPLHIAILPGSRDEALANLRYIAARLLECNPGPRYTIALAPSIDISQVKDAFEDTGWVVSPDGLRHSQTGTHISISRDFLHTVHHADMVIGLAGTANEQAAFLGKRVICFKGKGPQSSLKRFHEQAKLMGERILVLNNEDHSLSIALDQIFQNPLDHMPLALPELQNASDSIIKYVSRKIN